MTRTVVAVSKLLRIRRPVVLAGVSVLALGGAGLAYTTLDSSGPVGVAQAAAMAASSTGVSGTTGRAARGGTAGRARRTTGRRGHPVGRGLGTVGPFVAGGPAEAAGDRAGSGRWPSTGPAVTPTDDPTSSDAATTSIGSTEAGTVSTGSTGAPASISTGPTGVDTSSTTGTSATGTSATGTSAASTSSGGSDLRAMEQQVISLTNADRLAGGCRPVTENAALMAAALKHAGFESAAQAEGHLFPGEQDLGTRDTAAGYTGWTALGENAAGAPGGEWFTSAEAVMHGGTFTTMVNGVDTTFTSIGWMQDAAHKANILDCSFTDIGVGVVRDAQGALWWSQDFGARS